MNLDLFVAAFVTIFVISDPIGTAAVFSVMTKSMTRPQVRRLAATAVGVALTLFAFFGYFGMKLLGYMNISLIAFRLAGGLLLFVTAFRMIMGRHDEGSLQSEDTVYADKTSLAVFPLAIPLLAGPGCLTAFLLLLGRAETASDTTTVLLAVVLVQMSALAAFLLAAELKRLLGQGLMTMIARVMGILLASMAVQFIIDGIRAVLPTLQG
jgi:multiple antibiotic resistance protein